MDAGQPHLENQVLWTIVNFMYLQATVAFVNRFYKSNSDEMDIQMKVHMDGASGRHYRTEGRDRLIKNEQKVPHIIFAYVRSINLWIIS